jgi:hypothetical protein
MGLPCAEAAELRDCRVGTVRSRVARARATPVGLLAEADATAVRGHAGPASEPRDRAAWSVRSSAFRTTFKYPRGYMLLSLIYPRG